MPPCAEEDSASELDNTRKKARMNGMGNCKERRSLQLIVRSFDQYAYMTYEIAIRHYQQMHPRSGIMQSEPVRPMVHPLIHHHTAIDAEELDRTVVIGSNSINDQDIMGRNRMNLQPIGSGLLIHPDTEWRDPSAIIGPAGVL